MGKLINKIEVKIKLAEGASVPKYSTELSSGFDLCAHNVKLEYTENNYDTIWSKDEGVLNDSDFVLYPGDRYLIGTGIFLELPEGYELVIRPRSGLSLKKGIVIILGTIDNDYRGEIGLIIQNNSTEPFIIKSGDRLAQGVIQKVTQAEFKICEELTDTVRGDGGFGHTGV